MTRSHVGDAFRKMMRPLAVRVANSIARAVVELVDDSKKLQLLQLHVLEGEIVDDGEHFQGYGFKSVPLPGAEAVVLFPNGDRAHPLVVGVDDRRHRPTGWAAGESGLYNNHGAIVRLKADGTIEAHAGGTPVALALKSDVDALIATFNAHMHASAAPGAPTSAPATVGPAVDGVYPVPVPAGAGSSVGTSKLRAQ